MVGPVARTVRQVRRGVRHRVARRVDAVTTPVLGAMQQGRASLDQRLLERERRQQRREVVRAHRRTGLKLPWRAHVVRARKAYEHLAATIESLPEGPLRDELWTTEPRVWDGLAALAEAAAAGQALEARLAELRPLLPRRGLLARPSDEPEAVRSTREATGTNVNLGIALLAAPIAAAGGDLAAVPEVLASLTPRDARAVYQAIGLASAGGRRAGGHPV